MPRLLLAALVMLIPGDFFLMQPKQSPANSATVTISLPANIPSETVQIRYFLIGSFGGYGGYMEPKQELSAYEIEASKDGEPASSIKIIVYAAGCRFQTFDPDLSPLTASKQRFVCESLPQTRISGQIPDELMRGENAQLSVHYMAFWANTFFGIKDGMVPDFQLVTATPDANGHFLLDIPDFSADTTASSTQGGASLSFRLRDSKTGNAFDLKPERLEFRTETQQLKVLPVYPGGVKFTDPRH
jgi:hypothetical protein